MPRGLIRNCGTPGAHFDAIDSVLGNGDMWESVNLQPEMLDALMSGRTDLAIEVTDRGFICTARQRMRRKNHRTRQNSALGDLEINGQRAGR